MIIHPIPKRAGLLFPLSFNETQGESVVRKLEDLSLDIANKPPFRTEKMLSWQESERVHRLKIIKNVHQDDIHSIIKLADGTFITGSKDGSLKKWNFDKQEITNLAPFSYINYTNWITALTVLNDHYWISGTRNGCVELWSTTGKYVRQLHVQHAPFQRFNNPICKQRNTHRVNCLIALDSHYYASKNLFLTGWPTQFTVHSLERRLSYTYTSSNDWVYAIQPIQPSSLLVVTGCCLDLWNRIPSTPIWEKKASYIKEKPNRSQRPFISAITPLQDKFFQFGLAVVDGSIKVFDLETEKIIFESQEHRGRVWAIENIRPSCFASCGDDGYIKIWDPRLGTRSIYTNLDNANEKARVSVLKLTKENELLSGSCPDNVKKAQDKAQFSFWELRKLSY